jgi:hypothetical protein
MTWADIERELESFFVNYHQLSGEQYQIIAVKGPSAPGAVSGVRGKAGTWRAEQYC